MQRKKSKRKSYRKDEDNSTKRKAWGRNPKKPDRKNLKQKLNEGKIQSTDDLEWDD
tara:strand:+ start:2318 stop:2485 length:168 start_codon:yes stop_codon:yes gene_type:complete